MLIYFDRKETVDPVRYLCAADHDPLLALGEVESACLDSGCPRELARMLDRSILRVARGLALDEYLLACLPRQLPISKPEGFAYYGLHPDTYRDAARRFYAAQRPVSALVVGVRSIGTTLSAVVCDELLRRGVLVHRTTVRPFGHPFDRQVRFDRELPDAEWTLVVDEGPGISGSSFLAVVDALQGRQVALLPSRNPGPNELRNDRARQLWPGWKKYFGDTPENISGENVSGGLWRNHDQIPVHPWWERKKIREGDRLWKFEGLGRYGVEAHRLASNLAEAGFTPQPLAIQDGMLATRWCNGPPGVPSATWIDGYLYYRGTLRSDLPGASFDELTHMVEVNCVKAGLRVPELSQHRAEVESAPRVPIDGRLLPWEFVQDCGRWYKTDAINHHCDHFFPGTQGLGWDVAGAVIELNLDSAQLCRAEQLAGRTLAFYKVAYAAFRLGYCVLAAETLTDAEEAQRFLLLGKRYRDYLTGGN